MASLWLINGVTGVCNHLVSGVILQAYIPQRKGKGTGLFFPVQCLFLKWVCFDKNFKYLVLRVCVCV